MEPLKIYNIKWFDFSLDIFIMINIFAVFFYAVKKDDALVTNPLEIAKLYIKRTFIIDLIYVTPSLLRAITDDYKWTYYFKLLRFIYI